MASQLQMTPPPLSSQSMADLLCTIMVLCQGQQNGKPFWAYLCVKPSMAKAFKEARDKGAAFNLEEYGTIIEHGEGKDVPMDVRKRMERDYGVRHDYEEQLLQVIENIEKKYAI